MTSRLRPVTSARPPSSDCESAERSIDRIVSALGCATRWTSRPARDGRAASRRACSITSPADIVDGGRSAMLQRPSFSIRMGIGSYFCRSRFANTAAAEASDTSCSPERPPYRTPTRRRFTGSEYRKTL